MEIPYLEELLEIRRRLLIVVGFFVCCFGLFFYFSNQILHFLIKPLLMSLGNKGFVIATQVTTPFVTPLQIAADSAFLTTIPFILLQSWKFMSPGLYLKEKKIIWQCSSMSLILFALGLSFCFYCILPYLFNFFVSALPTDIRLFPDLPHAISFIMRMLGIFGLAFQTPLLLFMLIYFGYLQLQTLQRIRPYVIVLAFILGMLLTPPDVLSQISLAIPLCLLYELGIIMAKFYFKLGLKSEKAQRY